VIDTPEIKGAAPSIGSIFSVDGAEDGSAGAEDLFFEKGVKANKAPPIIAAKQITPVQAISHFFFFLMRTSNE
jgi:hypothetical protein